MRRRTETKGRTLRMKGDAFRGTGIASGILLMLLVVATLSGCFGGPTPNAAFTATPQFDYPPLHVTFDASASSSPNGAIVSYEWDFGDGESDTGVTTSHTYTDKGVYTVTLAVTDSTGKIGARSMQVEAMNQIPIADFVVDKYWIGVYDPLEFDASTSYDPDGEVVQYLWDFGDGTTATGMVVEHEYGYSDGGSWKPLVTLTVIDDTGGSGSTSMRVNVVGCESCGS